MSVDATETDVTAPTTLMELRDLRKSYGDVQILAGIDFTVRRGEFVCVVGPSGSGKTTLLRCMAGLLAPTDGACLFEGDTVTGPPAKLAVVFQDYSRSLFPWLSVADNIELPLRRTVRKAERAVRIDSVLTAVGLAGKHDLYPWQMSGGMQQRAAIARGLAYQPDVLLMDEPFAAVDAQTRIELEDLVLRVRKDFDTTIVFVTHDIDEAVYLGDRVIVLSGAPTRVTRNIDVDLPQPRDQLETKTLPAYAKYRTEVFELIQAAQSHASIA
ncbi:MULTISPECIES: ABC transporter ATP-binding protein [Gordonia]|uniref:ABC transporter ATP-binding protein n=3 Tax=Gordonia TaxID=2053 RepID=A0ABN3HAQ9_9ACTN|nr:MULTISPECIES: ABC transporter ATP-binding protein [Gordonia]AUH70361.1 ABC transporter ATP-binding protein [Gordonia sp. YC-JH1]KJR05439.1 ABC transporter [Gordonia sihwensis]KXT57866.1 ABC transporter [Gordonia sp. QH-12]WFN94536.1 ABC transporter ATP-binding protein [Gordonia sihwensis]GAC60929.1 putative ABC transporter ATP-binding protein [Gordonia sihwensis NBRC 108236]